MSKTLITRTSLDRLDYDAEEFSPSQPKMSGSGDYESLTTPTVIFVFEGSDLNAAAHHLAQSLQSPLSANAVATVLLQESVRSDFIAILRPKLTEYKPNVSQHAKFARDLDVIGRLKVEIIIGSSDDEELSSNSPILVCDVSHEHLGADATGVVTVHTFRTPKEAIALCTKESLSFSNVSIWHHNHSCAYELVAALDCLNFFINCYEVSLELLQPYIEGQKNFVTMTKTYHYETLPHNGLQKSIVFPIGTIFAN